MQNEIIINSDPGETRVAIIERGQFSELFIERDHGRSVVSNVVKGRVTRVLPGMQAAFVDIGLEKAGFLYVGDYFAHNTGKGPNGDPPDRPRRRGRNGSSRSQPKIEQLLSEGQEIVVQIAKEPIGTKGARITSHISIAGRHLVLTPWAKRVGVSRRIDSDKERRRLREIVERLRPKDVGFIIRTAGDGVREADLEADIRYLTSAWEEIQTRNETATAPAVLYREPDLPLRMVRDFANPETKRVVIDSNEGHEKLQTFVERFVADPKPKIEHYIETMPVFDALGLESQIHANLERKAWLKSGGYLIIDQSEALTAVDVNTGRYIGKRDLEETVLKTNLEAVKEVVHQLRFRNIGGLIIIDLIDMESLENREKVYRALHEALRHDKARTNILKISELGLVEMTRKRTRENLVQMLCEPCAHCEGRSYVLSRESVAFRVLREIRNDLPRFCGRQIAVTVAPQVAEVLLRDSKALTELGEELGRELEVRARPGLHQEQFELSALDDGPPVEIPLRWLKNGDASGSKQGSAGPRSRRKDKDKAEAAEAGAAAEPGTGEAPSPEEAQEPAFRNPPQETPERFVDEPELEEHASASTADTPEGIGEPGALAEPLPIAQALDEAAESPILPSPERREES